MLGNKKNQKKTVFGGIGIALLLCALMALMPMSGFMSNDSVDVEFVESNTTGGKISSASPIKSKISNTNMTHRLNYKG